MKTKLSLASKADTAVGSVAERLRRLDKELQGPAMQKALNAGGAVLMKAVKKNARPIKDSGLLQKKIKVVRKKRVKQLGQGWVGIGVERGSTRVARRPAGYEVEAQPAKYAHLVEGGGHFGKARGKYTPPRPLFKAAQASAKDEVTKAVLGSLDKQITAALEKGRAR